MKRIFLLFTVVLLMGCSPQKRIARIAEKYNLKQWETVLFTDTVYIEAKTYIFETQIDSFGYFQQSINGNELVGRVKDSIVYVKLTTKADTIYIEKPVNIETIKVEKIEKKNHFLPLCIALVLACILGIFINRKTNEKRDT